MALALLLALAAAVMAGCGGDDGGSGDDQGGAATSTTTAPNGLQVLVTNADGLASPGLDALVQATYVLPATAVAAAAPAGPVPPLEVATPPALTFTPTSGGYPGISVQADAVTTVTASLTGQVEGVPDGIDLVIVGVNDGQLIGPLAGFDANISAAQAAVAAGVPALVVAAGSDEVPPDYAAAVQQMVAWLDEHREALLAGDEPAQVTVLNVPGCGFAEVRGVVEVPVATDEAGRDLNAVDCASTVESPADDIEAFTNGFATLSVLAAAPTATDDATGTTPAPETTGTTLAG